MSTIDKLTKLLTKPNIAESLEEDVQQQIVRDVSAGYRIDKTSMKPWLDANQEAIKIIKHCEDYTGDIEREFPFHKSAQVIYPLLAPATIQLAARLIQQIVRNDRVVECAILGKDVQEQVINPRFDPQDPSSNMYMLAWKKAEQAKRVSQYLNYTLLFESDTWLQDTHKLCTMVAAWGTAFRQVYYDPISKKICSEILCPEDVIINHNISSLDKARRITIRHYLTKNDLIERIRAKQFIDITESLSLLKTDTENKDTAEEINPAYPILCQYTYLDLDEDGYAEPYYVYTPEDSTLLLGIYPAFDIEEDVDIDEKGNVLSIKGKCNLVDYHLIDDPEGKFYSLGLNFLLLHQNKSITSILRQMIDSGTLMNQQGGFITNAFKTPEQNLYWEMGEFKRLECDPSVDPTKHIIPLPFKEPSQVLLALLQVLIQGGEKTGFITDVLTGDTQGQNVPATTMLAIVEQATRAIKPVVQKLYISLKKDFKHHFILNGKYLEDEKYIKFWDDEMVVSRNDFNADELDIIPVADPTQSSEAHKYAKIQAMLQTITNLPQAHNIPVALSEVYRQLGFENAEQYVAQPQPAPPDPKMMELQLKAALAPKELELEQLKVELAKLKLLLEERKVQIAEQDLGVKAMDSQTRTSKAIVDAHTDAMQILNNKELTKIEAYNAQTERERLSILERQQRDKARSK